MIYTDFFLVEFLFCTKTDFLSKLVLTAKELLRELVHDAHTLGLKVVLDVCLGRAVNVAGREELVSRLLAVQGSRSHFHYKMGFYQL